jgi:urea carboxylase
MWKIETQPGARVAAGERLGIIESMKMEIPVTAPVAGVVTDVYAVEGKLVTAGQVLFCVNAAG